MNQKQKLSIPLSRAEKVWGWVYMPLYLILLGPVLLMGAQWVGLNTASVYGQAMINGAYFLINFLVVLLIFRGFLWMNLRQLRKRFWGFVQAVILGLVMYFVGSLLINILISYISPNLSNPNDEFIVEMTQAASWIIIPGTVILAPFTEECLIRGLLFRGAYDRGRIWAYILSVTVFAVIHVLSYLGTVPAEQLALNFLQYIPAGIALAWAYEKADSIFAPIVMHCLINAIATGLSV